VVTASAPSRVQKLLTQLGPVSAEAALILLGPCALILARYFSWGAGPLRLLCLALLFAFIALATWRRGYLLSVWDRGRLHWVLAAVCALLTFMHVQYFVSNIRKGGECWTDMGRPSICSGEWLRRGLNPWAECAPPLKAAERKNPPESEATYVECVKFDRCIDYKGGRPYKDWKHHGPGFDFMDGYKYGPISAFAYFPLTHFYRERGVFSVNFAFWLLHGLLMWGLARAAFPSQRAAPWRAIIGWLAPLIVPLWATLPTLNIEALGHTYELTPPERGTFILEITHRCANDIIPVTLGLAALLMAARKFPLIGGVFLGLSLAAKPLPALLWCALLPGLAGNKARPLIVSAVLTTAFCYLPFFAWAPREMIANLISFSWLRPTNASSIRAYIPESLGGLIGALQLISCVVLTIAFYRSGPRDLGRLLRTSALSTIAFVAFNKVVHGNYLLWIQPLAALTLAGLPFRTPARASVRASQARITVDDQGLG
jgi:hypothetical protein